MIERDFNPSIFHPYYFIRKGLLYKIKEYSHFLNGKLLDFGCGSKPYISLFSFDEYIGVDFENEGHSHKNEQIDIFYDGKTIPVGDNSFDSALCSEVFEHVFNLEDVINELHRVLKPGGTLLVTCPFVWPEHEIPNDYARYTHFALEYLFKKNGFDIVKKDKSGSFIEVIFQLIVLFLEYGVHSKVRKILVVNSIVKVIFIAIPNIIGLLLYKLTPTKKTLYLNNVFVVRKKSN
jgi:SAM-dependent methyltransferase